MARALDELVVDGVDTSISWHRRVMDEPDFRAGRLSIRYVEDHPALAEAAGDEELIRAAAVAAAMIEHEDRRRHRTPRVAASDSSLSAWRSALGRPNEGPKVDRW
jgi:acetyl/propionyl-CoA carboxylase alpha subunit